MDGTHVGGRILSSSSIDIPIKFNSAPELRLHRRLLDGVDIHWQSEEAYPVGMLQDEESILRRTLRESRPVAHLDRSQRVRRPRSNSTQPGSDKCIFLSICYFVSIFLLLLLTKQYSLFHHDRSSNNISLLNYLCHFLLFLSSCLRWKK